MYTKMSQRRPYNILGRALQFLMVAVLFCTGPLQALPLQAANQPAVDKAPDAGQVEGESAASDKQIAVPPSLALAMYNRVQDEAVNTPMEPLSPELADKPEVESARSAYQAVFDLGDGEYAMVQDSQQLNYQDQDGRWQRIQPGLEAVPDGWVNTANSLKTSLATSRSNASLSLEGVGVSWQPRALSWWGSEGQEAVLAEPLDPDEAAAGVRSADSSSINYPQSWSLPALQDRWQVGPGMAAYSMRFDQGFQSLAAQTDTGFDAEWMDLVVRLRLRPGTSLQVDGKPASLPFETEGKLAFVNNQGETLYLQPAQIFEAGDPMQRLAGVYKLSASDRPDTLELRARFERSWLADPSRNYPLVLDPIFQTRSPFLAKQANYAYSGDFQSAYEQGGMLGVGSFNGGYSLGMVHFEMPTLPPGTQISKAYLAAAPSDISLYQDFYSDEVNAYPLTDSAWQTMDNQQPKYNSTPLPVWTGSPMRWTPSGIKLPTVWDVTSLALQWQADPNSNHGVLLSVSTVCESTACGGFFFDYPSKFSAEDLQITDDAAQGGILWTLSAGSGIRLIVYYSAPTLTVGNPITADPPLTDNHYFNADHVYNIPALPSAWQAVIARGFSDCLSCDFPAIEIRNTPPLEIRERSTAAPPSAAANEGAVNSGALGSVASSSAPANPEGTQAGTPPGYDFIAQNLDPNLSLVNKGLLSQQFEVSYAMLNGRASAGKQLEARMGALDNPNSLDYPHNYDIQLVNESGEISLTEPGVVQDDITFSSLEVGRLWNLNLPVNTNNRVFIEFLGISGDTGHYSSEVSKFSAQLMRGDGGVWAYRNDSIDTQGVPFKPGSIPAGQYGQYRLVSGQFEAETSNYGLLLAYNQIYYPGSPGPGGTEADFNVRVRVVSCKAGSFPTASGDCQKVDCPVQSNFDIANFKPQAGLGLWAAGGWNGNTSKYPSVAPMVGGPNVVGWPTNFDTPSVAIIDGVITYGGGAVNVGPAQPGSETSIYLVDCQAGNPSFTQKFFVSGGKLASMTHPDPDKNNTVLAIADRKDVFFDPWYQVDQNDLSNQVFYVDPLNGRAGESGLLKRRIGPGYNTDYYLRVETDWYVYPGGLDTLDGYASYYDSGVPPTLAGLSINLGAVFDLDVDPVLLKFSALRAKNATVSQPINLGGASKKLQVLIFPTNAPVPVVPAYKCGFYNCFDLRAPNDTPAAPNRIWQMPDIHITDTARLMTVSTPGSLDIYSQDFPQMPSPVGGATPFLPVEQTANQPVAPSDFNGSFSYDTFGAQVAITLEACEGLPNEPKVQVIRGATQLAMPNIGAGQPPAMIGSSFKLCQGSLRQVRMTFRTPVGIPIGNSGLFLTGLEGTVDIYPGHTTITFDIDFQAAPGGDGGLLRMHGQVKIDTRGLFEFQGSGDVLQGLMGADGKLWVAWNPIDIGFEASMVMPRGSPFLYGMIRAHMWRGQGFLNRYNWLPDNDEFHLAAQFRAELHLRQGEIFQWWWIDIPPEDTVLVGVEIALGQFCTNAACSTYEWGIKGKLVVLDYDIGLYYSFGKDLFNPEIDPGNISFILGNDDHVLIDQYGEQALANAAQRKAAVFNPADPVKVYRSPAKIDAQDDLIPIEINTGVDQTLFALGWSAGAPQLSLIDPDGVEITALNAGMHGAKFQTSMHSTLVSVKDPKPGSWQAKISNLSEDGIEYYKFTYFANHGGPVKANQNPLLTPSMPEEVATDVYTITWSVPAGTSDSATISLFASTDIVTGTLDQVIPIVQNYPFKAGSYVWDLKPLPFGTYQIFGQVQDGINTVSDSSSIDFCDPNYDPLSDQSTFDPLRFPPSQVFTATGTIQPNEPTFPDAPTNLVLTPLDGALLARWDPSKDPTVTDYIVFICNQANCARNQTVLDSETPQLYINALNNGVMYDVYIYSRDVTGNWSVGWGSAFASATPDASYGSLPGAPLNLDLVSASGASAILSWEAGEGPAPVGYRLRYQRSDIPSDAQVLDVTGTSATLDNLQPGATYLVKVSALTADDWEGPASTPIQFVASSGQDNDGDGLPDDWAQFYGISGGTNDPDGDGLDNSKELEAGTDPTDQNSDNDAFSDGEEVADGTDPLNRSNHGSVLGQPRLSLAQNQVVLRLDDPNALPQVSVLWSNTGGGALSLQTQSSVPWLIAEIAGDQVVIRLRPGTFEPGAYTGVVKLTPAAGSDPLIGAPSCIRVQLWATQAPLGGIYLPLVVR